MRRSPRTSLMALLVAVLAIAAAGCGGSEVASDEVPGAPPAITVPTDSDLGGGGGGGNNSADNADSGAEENDSSTEDGAADPGTAEPEATAEPPAETGGGTAAPEATAAPDTATNDTQPEPGSPPEQFEDFCEQNAGAC